MNHTARILSLKRLAESHQCSTCTLHNCFVLTNCRNSIEEISEAKKRLVYERGSRLNGNIPDGIYFLSQGKLKIYKTDKHDEEVILNFIKPGEIFSILRNDDNDEYPFQIRALEDSALCFVDGNSLMNMTQTDPQLLMSLYKFQYQQSNQFQDRYFKTMRMNVPAKVADALLTMHEAYGIDHEGNLDVKLSRSEIAGLATTTKEQVSKVLSEFKAAGVLKTKGKKIMISNFAKLKSAAGS